MPSPKPDLAERAGALQASVQVLSKELKATQSEGRRTSRILRFAILGLIFDVALSVGLGIVGFQARDASNQAKAASSARRVNCLAINKAKALEQGVWEHLFLLPQLGPKPTAAQQRQADDLKAYFAETFKPDDCSTT